MKILAIETTCDETAAAIIDESRKVVAAAVASQEEIHNRFQGVVPELAARCHLERIIPIVEQVLAEASVEPKRDLLAVAVATEPGLPGSLLVGLAAAKGFCLGWGKPLIAINHIQAHIYACQMGHAESVFPCVGFVVSGGHTNLYRCETPNQWKYLGGTIDDAVGEAFDKVSVMLGLPYPGGPHLSRLAERGDDRAFDLPRPMLSDASHLNMSFSGLKTAVRYKLVGVGKQDFAELDLPEARKADVAASFERAAIDCLVGKAKLALKSTGLRRLCVGGGVAANRRLRKELQLACDEMDAELILAAPDLCTDNASMGAIAWEKAERNEFSDLDIDVQPGLVRG